HSRSRDLPGIELLHERLVATQPAPGAASLLHGDFRLDNCLVSDGRVTAVLDWEMATLGDPMVDLATSFVYYAGFSDLPNNVVTSPAGVGAFPAWEDVATAYATVSGREVGSLEWYVGFAWFKLAVILEGIHFRASGGLALPGSYAGVADLVQPCIERGLE